MICVRTLHDDVLGVFAPIAIAAVRPTALVVDLEQGGLPLPGSRSLADLLADPSADLQPSQRGVACLPRGDVSRDDALSLIERLCASWPDVVIRGEGVAGARAIRVAPDLRAIESPSPNTIWVRAEHPSRSPSVPPPPRSAILAVLAGRLPPGRWRRPWRAAWEFPWQ